MMLASTSFSAFINSTIIYRSQLITHDQLNERESGERGGLPLGVVLDLDPLQCVANREQ